ncbi:MAG: hypothetical protein NZ455_08850 [Bacteroidia bacterium]|nr:hypothetical protein [Bacteroidia bacterium]
MSFILWGCPYSSDVPIDEAKEKVNPDLMGKWTKDVNSENPKFYNVTKASDTKYNFEENTWNSTDKKYDKKNYTGHTTTIGGDIFLNMESGGKYYLYKIVLRKNEGVFELIEVTDNIKEKFTKSADLKAFVTKYKDLSFFYNKEVEKYKKS